MSNLIEGQACLTEVGPEEIQEMVGRALWALTVGMDPTESLRQAHAALATWHERDAARAAQDAQRVAAAMAAAAAARLAADEASDCAARSRAETVTAYRSGFAVIERNEARATPWRVGAAKGWREEAARAAAAAVPSLEAVRLFRVRAARLEAEELASALERQAELTASAPTLTVVRGGQSCA